MDKPIKIGNEILSKYEDFDNVDQFDITSIEEI